jgi:hypothetical protein
MLLHRLGTLVVDFLTRLVEKTLGVAPVVEPRIPPRFAPDEGTEPRWEDTIPEYPDVESVPAHSSPRMSRRPFRSAADLSAPASPPTPETGLPQPGIASRGEDTPPRGGGPAPTAQIAPQDVGVGGPRVRESYTVEEAVVEVVVRERAEPEDGLEEGRNGLPPMVEERRESPRGTPDTDAELSFAMREEHTVTQAPDAPTPADGRRESGGGPLRQSGRADPISREGRPVSSTRAAPTMADGQRETGDGPAAGEPARPYTAYRRAGEEGSQILVPEAGALLVPAEGTPHGLPAEMNSPLVPLRGEDLLGIRAGRKRVEDTGMDSPPASPPTVRISIGRVDVRAAITKAEPRPEQPSAAVPRLSLEEYLRSRREDH